MNICYHCGFDADEFTIGRWWDATWDNDNLKPREDLRPSCDKCDDSIIQIWNWWQNGKLPRDMSFFEVWDLIKSGMLEVPNAH